MSQTILGALAGFDLRIDVSVPGLFLLAPIVVVLVAGAVTYALSRLSPLVCKALTLAAGSLTLLSGVAICLAHWGQEFHWTWLDLAPGFSLRVDLAPTTLGMVVLIGGAAFAILITVYSFSAMAGHYWEGKFYAYLNWSLAGACIVALAGNLLVLLIGWEIVTLMLFLMINQGLGDAKAGAAKTYGVLGLADACLLMALALLAAEPGGSANWSLSRGPVDVASMGAVGYAVYVLIMIAALAKAGAIPLHTWIPAAAEDAPTPVMAYLPGSLDKLLGIYLLATLSFRIFAPDATMGITLLVIGCVTLLGAGLMAVMQSNLNKALAFDAVSQVGYMVIGLGGGLWLLASGQPVLAGLAITGGLFHMLNHAIYKSGLFLVSGVAARASGTAEMHRMGGLASVMPATFVCALILAMSAAGIPPLSGFASKWLVFQGTLGMHNSGSLAVLVAAVFASALSLAVFVKILHAAFLSPSPRRPDAPKLVLPSRRGDFWVTAPMVVLAAACVLLGLLPQIITNDLLGPVVASAGAVAVGRTGAVVEAGPIGLWNPTQATMLILLGVVSGLGFVWISMRGSKVRVARPFVGGEVPAPADDRFRVPGTHFYETIGKLPAIGPLLRNGQEGAMDLYRWFGKYGQRLVDVLRAQHTGLICLYVAWCVLGLTVILVYILLTTGT